jgi:hypothetical protein
MKPFHLSIDHTDARILLAGIDAMRRKHDVSPSDPALFLHDKLEAHMHWLETHPNIERVALLVERSDVWHLSEEQALKNAIDWASAELNRHSKSGLELPAIRYRLHELRAETAKAIRAADGKPRSALIMEAAERQARLRQEVDTLEQEATT